MHNSISKMKMDIILDNKEKFAEEFSEGSSLLKSCLLNLWNNKIYTVGCCIGHKEREKSVSYIGIDLTNSNINNVINLLSNIDKKNIKLGFTASNNKSNCSIKSFNKNDDLFFENIINSLEKNYIKSNDSEFHKKIGIIKNNNSNYLTFQYVYKDNNLVKKYCITNNELIINKYKCKYLSEIYNKKNNFIYFNML